MPATAERSSEMPPSDSGRPRIGSPTSRPAFRTVSGAAQASSASAAAGLSTSSASSVTTSTSSCSSSVGVRSKAPVPLAGLGRVPARPDFPARANWRLAAVAVRKPVRVTVNTAVSACLRRPIRSRTSLRASRLSAATAYPIGSRDSFDESPCFPPGLRLWIRDMGLM